MAGGLLNLIAIGNQNIILKGKIEGWSFEIVGTNRVKENTNSFLGSCITIIDSYLKSVLRDQNIGKIAVAYTVWSKKKGGGKLIVKEVFKKIKKSNHLNRLVTLSPLTEMARNFHLHNGAIELQVNEKTQNFEYKI